VLPGHDASYLVGEVDLLQTGRTPALGVSLVLLGVNVLIDIPLLGVVEDSPTWSALKSTR
jgi:hypothetical protein